MKKRAPKARHTEYTQEIIETLTRLYPNPKPPLKFTTPFELVVATILSAQCTDERVNKVTPALFAVANTPTAVAVLGEKGLIRYIRSTGFYNAKAHNIIGMSRMLIEKFGGQVPGTLEELMLLPGVGRKTASVVLCQAFKVPAFPVDRHVLRVANRLGLAHAKTPDETDLQLRKKIPKNLWIPLHLQLVFHGRAICRPKPNCLQCPLRVYCPTGKKIVVSKAKTKKGIFA